MLVYGVERVAETLLVILKERIDKSLKILALIDYKEEKQNKELLGYKIISFLHINKYEHIE